MILLMKKTSGVMQATIVNLELPNHTRLPIPQVKAINVLPETTAHSNRLPHLPARQVLSRLVIAPISVKFVLLVSTAQEQPLNQSSVLQATVQLGHLPQSSALMAHMLMQPSKGYLIKPDVQFVQMPNGVAQV